MSNALSISSRKHDHLKYALSSKAQIGNPGFDKYYFTHNALPEINFDSIDISTTFLGKKINYPFFISCMSGGLEKGININKNLALAAQKYKIPMGVGSQRIAIVHPEYEKQFKVRKYTPDIPLMANIGLVQLNYGFGLKEFQQCVDMIEADALVVHINPIQEVIQPEGDRNFEKLIPKLEKIVKRLTVPVIAKEVGFGLSEDVVKRLFNIGVRIFDTAGWGGTNWAMVEGMRGKADLNLANIFSDWGIPTAESIKQIAEYKSKYKSKKNISSFTFYYLSFDFTQDKPFTILGSGGIRSGIDIAKSIALGADLAGIAAPFAKAALEGADEVEKLVQKYAFELKTAMFGVGAANIKKLKSLNYLTCKG